MTRIVCALLLGAVAVAGLSCSGGQTVPSQGKVEYTGDSVSDVLAAVKAGDDKTVDELLAGDPTLTDVVDENGWTLLHVAVLSNRPDLIELLVQKGMDPNIEDENGETPLAALENSGIRAEQARQAIIAAGGK